MLSNACQYGLRAALLLASLEAEGYVPIRRLSEELDLSFPFLTKILQQLTQAGLLASFRGPNGGIAFTKPTHQISLREIIVAIDGPELFEGCVLGLPGCGAEKPCPVHEQWATQRNRLEQMFSHLTLAYVADHMAAFNVRLKAAGPG